MDRRAREEAVLPSVHVVDMRQEMMAGNKTMFSRVLYEKLKERLDRKEQSMLFLNRRGYSSFISCRSCGEAIRCPHCDVTLTLHRSGQLKCHYCGYTISMVKSCPSCSSPYVAGFGTGSHEVRLTVSVESAFEIKKVSKVTVIISEKTEEPPSSEEGEAEPGGTSGGRP